VIARAGRERSRQTSNGTRRSAASRVSRLGVGARGLLRFECGIYGRSAAASQILDLPATPPPSIAAERKSELSPGRSRYNNCFIVHSLSLTRALYVSTVSDRFA
jgi:hypothetical protein